MVFGIPLVILFDSVPFRFLSSSAVFLHVAFLSTSITCDGWSSVGLDLVEGFLVKGFLLVGFVLGFGKLSIFLGLDETVICVCFLLESGESFLDVSLLHFVSDF